MMKAQKKTSASMNNSITKQDIESICDPKEYRNTTKYPFINYLPFNTKPSDKYRRFEKACYRAKRNWLTHKSVYEIRNDFEKLKLDKTGAIQNVSVCTATPFTIPGNINGYKVVYSGSNDKHGAIIEVHGGGYCVESAKDHLGFGELISKLTKCVVFHLEYKLAPECIIPSQRNELITLYKYLVYDLNISPNKIAFTGDSAGGGIILSALLCMRKTNDIQLPCCVWLNSLWANLSNKSNSNKNNRDIECMMGYPMLDLMASWAVGNLDSNLNVIGDNDKFNPKYSPLFDSESCFKGLCPMYFMVGAQEILFDDTVECAKKAHKCGVEVICDIEPFMCHSWPTFSNLFPESGAATHKACNWIMKQFKLKSHSKL
eukprot:48598_1